MRTDWYPDRANHHADETVLRLCFATLCGSTLHVVLLEERHGRECHTQTDPDGDEHETSETLSPVVVTDEDDWITEEERVLYRGG